MSKTQFRIYYEDTDAGGVVYYANYLKFAERARTEYLRDLGLEQSKLLENDGIIFVVRHVEMDLLKPGRLDDLLDIETTIEKLGGASVIMYQQISCNGNALVNVKVVIASVNSDIKPAKLPEHVRKKMG
jgi:acyl-CoA thioester hydrolase